MSKATRSRNQNPSDAAPLNWGILATGLIAQRFVADLHASGAGRAVACGSRTIEGARSFAARYGIARAYGSYGELARDSEVEAVYVATPHNFHFNDALACLRNGKSVLCEKPLTLNAKQAAALFEEAEKNNVFLMEALWSYFLPAWDQVRRWLDDEAIGDVRLVTANFGFRASYNPQGRLFDPALAGGALLDVGVYALSAAQLVAGNKTPKVKATATMAPTGVDESTSVLLEWNSGLRAQLSCSVAHNLASNDAVVYGTKGTITVPDFWMAKSATLETSDGRTLFEDTRKTLGYDFEAKAMTADIRAGLKQDPMISPAFSLRLAATMDTVRKQIGLVYPGEEQA